jgi:hypothetical protein
VGDADRVSPCTRKWKWLWFIISMTASAFSSS